MTFYTLVFDCDGANLYFTVQAIDIDHAHSVGKALAERMGATLQDVVVGKAP